MRGEELPERQREGSRGMKGIGGLGKGVGIVATALCIINCDAQERVVGAKKLDKPSCC